jgi:hypothetical protein
METEISFSHGPRSPARPAASYLTQSTFEELPDKAMVAANANAGKGTSSGIRWGARSSLQTEGIRAQ